MSLWKSQDAALATGGKNTLSWSASGQSSAPTATPARALKPRKT